MKVKLFSSSGIFQNNVIMDGFTLIDFLTLYRNPDGANEAATKKYVDSFPTVFNVNQIKGSPIPKALLVGGFGGDLMGFNRTDAFLPPSGVTAGSYNRVTVDRKGRITAGTTENYGGNSVLHFANIINRPAVASGYISNVSGYAVRTNGANSELALTDNLYTTTTPTVSGHAATRNYLSSKASVMVPKIRVGDIKISTGAIAGANYLRANGGILNKTTYAALYAIIGDKYYGLNSDGFMGQPWVQQYAFNGNVDTALTWTGGTSLPTPLAGSASAVTRNYVYLFSGCPTTTTVTAAVYMAPINANGSLGTWVSTTPLPEVMIGAKAIITKNRVYVIGGGSNMSTATAKIYTAPINADGTLGTWTGGGTLPAAMGRSSVVVCRDQVYLLGGHNGAYAMSAIYRAKIETDGTILSWMAAGTLPTVVFDSQAIYTNSRIYLIGGHNGSVPLASVYSAPINADGSLGTWTTAASLPASLYSSFAFATRNRIYVLGGSNTTAPTATIYTVPINPDDTLGAWASAGSLPLSLASVQGVCVNTKLHLLGGWSGSVYINSVYTTPYQGGTNDYIDVINSHVPNETTFKLPDYSAMTNGVMEYFIRALP